MSRPSEGDTLQRVSQVEVSQQEGEVDGQLERAVMLGRTWVGDCWYAPVNIVGADCYALMDTGSSATLVKPELVVNKTAIIPTMVKLQGVTGEGAPMVRETLVTRRVGKKTVHCPVWVANLDDCILGLDALMAMDCVINTRRGTLSFPDGHVVQMYRRPPQPDCLVTHTITTQTTGTATNMADSYKPKGMPSTPHVTPAVTNPQPQLRPATQPDEDKRVLAVKEVWQKNCDGLTPTEQDLLLQLLLQFKDCFSLSEEDVGQTELIEHSIDTGDAQPIRMRPRRLPLARQAAADKALVGMQQAGLIEPSTSSWASPVVMVPKKQKEDFRFCVDFRPLNKVTKKDPYPLPRIDETLDVVAGSSWFSSLDLRSGYWQVPLTPEARPKTAFIASGGLWQFKVLPFGLCNAPATFERLMDRVLAGIPRRECVVYLDDILVHGDSFESALGSLRCVLGRVAAAGLKLHPQKCCFMRREVTFSDTGWGRVVWAPWRRKFML